MPQHKDRRSSKSQLGVWTTVFFYTVIVLQLTHISGGESPLNSQHRMLAVIGHTQDIILPCKLDPATDAMDEMVEWSRSDLNPRFVHVWRSGEDLLVDQNPSYKNRTSVSTEKLKKGDVSLKLTKVRLSDEGTYRCFIPGLNADFNVELVVEADIQITKVSLGVLECKSKGWYPEPDVFWLDSEGKIIPAGSKEIFRGPDDLYVLSSRLTLEKGHSNNITCRIQQNSHQRDAKIHVPDNLSARSTIAGLIAGIIFIIFVAFLVWKWRKNNMETKKCSNDGESQNGRMDKTCTSVTESESLIQKKKAEVNDTAQFSVKPGSSNQIEVENEYHISNKNLPQTTKSGTQQNNNQPGRETAKHMCRNEETQSGNETKAQPEKFDNNTERRKDEIPDQSLMDDSGQEQQPKQEEEAKSDTSNEENKNKTQTVNAEAAGQNESEKEVKQSAHSEGEEMKCQQGNSNDNIFINGEKNPSTSQGSATNQNQIDSDVARENASKEDFSANTLRTPSKLPDSEESQSEKTIVMSEEDGDEGSKQKPDTLPSRSVANEKNQDQSDSKQLNTDEHQSENNPTTDQSLTGADHQQKQSREGQVSKNNNDTSQNDPSEAGKPKDDKEKVSKSKAKAQSSHPEVSTTTQEQPGNETQLHTEEHQSGNSATTNPSPIDRGQQEEESRESRDAKSVPEDQNGEKTQTTNNKTTDSANEDISQNNQAEGGNPKEKTEKDSDSKAKVQSSDPEGSTTNQEQPGHETQLNTEEQQSENNPTTDQSLTGADHQQKQSREGQVSKNNNNTSQNDPSEAGKPKDKQEKVSKSKTKAQPSDPEVSTTNQKKPVDTKEKNGDNKRLTSVEENQSGKGTREDQSEQQEESTEEGEIETDAKEDQETKVH